MAAVVLTLIELDERGVAWITGTQVTVIEVATHPAMTVPCGMSDGLPIGLMLIGKHCDEPMISRAAYAFEQAGDWKAM